jgi:hypothetical protein
MPHSAIQNRLWGGLRVHEAEDYPADKIIAHGEVVAARQ